MKELMVKTDKLIGLLGHKVSGRINDGYGQNEAYVGYFRKFGNVVIIDAQNTDVLPLDLLVLPGGRDVNPANYGAAPQLETQAPDLEYEYFMANTLPKYIERSFEEGMGIYGICAGFQHLVAYFGGTLDQHMAQKQSDKYRGELVDRLKFEDDAVCRATGISKKSLAVEKKSVHFSKTNSIHHQGAFKEDINEEEFDILAYNADYGNVEFIKHVQLPIAAEQSHPEERDFPILSDLLINKLLNK